MGFPLIARFTSWVRHGWQQLQARILKWTQPVTVSQVVGTLGDLPRSRAELMVENTLLRQQMIVLQRQVKRPAFKGRDRLALVLLASRLRTWNQALVIVQPDTILRWHRDLFKWIWRRESKPTGHRRPLPRR
jgi:hypothetical protein